ncbi:MAG: 3-phosphoglycerate dehydrogenase [Acidimicrobiia bacterium]|nr:3-phosphoglycerate dehydrogenase [Acidimicrobiia bacterium]
MTVMPAAHRALVTAPFRGEGLDTLKELADVVLDPWIDYRPLRILDGPKLADRIKEEGADILIVESDFVNDPVFDPPLVAIGSCRGDPNNVDIAGATKAGIPVLRAPGRNADAVAEIAVTLLFAASRHVIPADEDVRNDTVFKDDTIPYQRYRAWQIAGQTAGLVGLGAVGRALRWRLEGLGMKVVAYDPYADDANESLEQVLDQADVISLHAAVTPETTGMISTDQFAAMKDGVVFLNTAREALHDRDALVAALQSGKVAAAGLDHFTGERLDTDHPLTHMSNVVLTPHIGGATYDTEANHSRLIADDLSRLLAGERPQHIMNPEVLK